MVDNKKNSFRPLLLKLDLIDLFVESKICNKKWMGKGGLH